MSMNNVQNRLLAIFTDKCLWLTCSAYVNVLRGCGCVCPLLVVVKLHFKYSLIGLVLIKTQTVTT